MLELDKYGYTRDASTSVWVRPDFSGIAYSDGDTAENTLAKIIREANDVSVLSPELPQYCTDWAKLYHLSPSRGNLFRPFEHLLKGRRVLEIGAGCGAISRYLGEAGAQVLALEGSPRRAAIAASRTRDLDNVTVLAERFDDFKVEEQFDVVTLIGVLEYASMFSADPDPAHGMLKRIRQLLKPDGHLFIAIENQLGLKYFAGAPEDHIGIAMYGIEGRYEHGQPKTFGKKELEQLIARSGFASSEFLSPCPDYKLPNSLITENGFVSSEFDAAELAWQNARKDPQLPAHTHFNLEKTWPVVIDNQLGMDLANSFLVVASNTQERIIAERVLAYHYSTGRKADYCKQAIFVKTPVGIKVRSNRLDGMSHVTAPVGSACETFHHILSAEQDYAEGNVLSAAFLEAALSQGWTVESFGPFLQLYLNSLRTLLASEGATVDLGNVSSTLPGRYLDAVPQNVVVDNEGNPQLIDLEWEMTAGVELGHLLMRGLLLLIASATPFSSSPTSIGRRDFIIQLLATAGLAVSEQDLDRYAQSEAEFQEQVTGRAAGTFLNWLPDATVPVVGTEDSAAPKLATLYYCGKDGSFSEANSLSQLARDGEQTLVFDISQLEAEQLRFDPVNACQPFSVTSVRLLAGNDLVWAWAGETDAPLQAVGAVAVGIRGRKSLYISTGADPFVLLHHDASGYIHHPQLILQVTFSLLQEHDIAALFTEHQQHLDRSQEELVGNEARISSLSLEISTKDTIVTDLNAQLAEKNSHNADLTDRLASKDTHIHNLNLQLIALHNSRSWKLSAPIRKLGGVVRRGKRALNLSKLVIERSGGLKNIAKKATAIWRAKGLAGLTKHVRQVNETSVATFVDATSGEVFDRNDYGLWVDKYDMLDQAQKSTMLEEIGGWNEKPLISIVMPVYNPPLGLLREAIDSVKAQLYTEWELCLADDASTDPDVATYLKAEAAGDARIKVVFRPENGHISRASNSAIECASGEFIALMDNDDLIPPDALYWIARTAIERPDVAIMYSDEDKIDVSGKRSAPYFKTDWNLYLFRSHNMISHLGVYRRGLVESVGGFRIGMEGSQDYDLALRCIEQVKPEQIVHIPRVLYHWRIHPGSTAMSLGEKPYAQIAGQNALDEHLKRVGIAGHAELLDFGMYRVHYDLPAQQPLVSLIIPTRNAMALVRQCIESIKFKTTYQNYEIILIDNGSDDQESIEYFETLKLEPNIRVLRDDGPFNYSALNNRAVSEARGELIGLINNDIEVISPDWLGEMVSLALQPGAGAVGARLWYPDDRLQHGGIIMGPLTLAGHAHKFLPRGHHGYFGRASLIQGMSAVTAACLIVRKSTFEEVGGLDEVELKIAFNDVDFCLKVMAAGYQNIWTPNADLYHHESATRGLEDTPEKIQRFLTEVRYVQEKWKDIISHDPAYNPNLSFDFEDFSLAFPPRESAVKTSLASNLFAQRSNTEAARND